MRCARGTLLAADLWPRCSFSPDGLTWYTADVQPYFNEVNYTAGGPPLQMSTRERPKLLFDDSGNPTHLYNGICPTPHCPPQVSLRLAAVHTCRSRHAASVLQAAIQCKVQGLGPMEGYWDRTLVTPLLYD